MYVFRLVYLCVFSVAFGRSLSLLLSLSKRQHTVAVQTGPGFMQKEIQQQTKLKYK